MMMDNETALLYEHYSRCGPDDLSIMDLEKLTRGLVTTQKAYNGAINFDNDLRELINRHMNESGMNVAQAISVLECIKTEIAVSFTAASGGLDDAINQALKAEWEKIYGAGS